MRIATGADLDAFLGAGKMLPELVGHAGVGKIARVGKRSKRFVVPDAVKALIEAN